MTHPLDRLSANPPPACDEPDQPGTEHGDECGRWHEPDEDCPVAWQCSGTMIDEDGVTVCDRCGERE